MEDGDFFCHFVGAVSQIFEKVEFEAFVDVGIDEFELFVFVLIFTIFHINNDELSYVLLFKFICWNGQNRISGMGVGLTAGP